MGGARVYYMDWMRVGAPIAIVTMLLMWVLGQKLVRKYQRQLSLDLVERAGVTPKSKKDKSDESEA